MSSEKLFNMNPLLVLRIYNILFLICKHIKKWKCIIKLYNKVSLGFTDNTPSFYHVIYDR